jgi:hypothetical protein
MIAKQQLRKPENWQDFESLCKKLWGEIWKCPEIKKNGRQGQSQHGVDVYGIPYDETEYYGIQCKGKDEYTHQQLTEKEIDDEIKKAKKFEPALKKFFFATTANKDAKIEAYIRKKNIANKKKNSFEIHIFSWEDIVDLIDENKQTYDYYVRSINYKTDHLAIFLFENGEEEITVKVPFKKIVTHYKQRIIPASQQLFGMPSFNINPIVNIPFPISPLFDNSFNHSYCRFFFRLYNKGTEPIKEFKIFFQFEGKYESIDTCSKGHLLSPNYNYDTFIWEESKQGKIVPLKHILVQDDFISFDTICLKPFPEPSKIEFKWKLVSLDYKNEGILILNIVPEFILKEETVLVEDPTYVRTEENIEDYITRGKEDIK